MAQGVGGYACARDADGFEDLLELAALIEEPADLERFVRRLPAPVRRRLIDAFGWQAHGGQGAPDGDWDVWLLMAGRGFGKTLAGAKWVGERAREAPAARIALVGATIEDCVAVMVEGPSGLLASARTGERPLWVKSRLALVFPSGAEAHVYSAERPEKLRGPEHDFAWCDELAKWGRGEATWDNLMLGMRRGKRPRVMVTTTPRAVPLLKRIRALPGCVETRGRTADNVHSAAAYRAAAYAAYGSTRLGRQELEGELIEEVEGSLWPRHVIERSRQSGILPREGFRRVVVGVDPPASAEGDACGIVVCGMAADGRLWVLADGSVQGLRPEGWARAVAAAAEGWGADRVVAEKNQGGDMVESVLRGAGAFLPVKLVSASRGKSARAEPVATLFEAGRAGFAGFFPELEDELAGIRAAGGYEGPGRSPDRADAMVWAMAELMGPAREPRVRSL